MALTCADDTVAAAGWRHGIDDAGTILAGLVTGGEAR